jgi:hypothetical protein
MTKSDAALAKLRTQVRKVRGGSIDDRKALEMSALRSRAVDARDIRGQRQTAAEVLSRRLLNRIAGLAAKRGVSVETYVTLAINDYSSKRRSG